MAADRRVVLVGANDHDRRVPADETADAFLEAFVAWIGGLLIGANRVDVRGLDEQGHVHAELAGVVDHPAHEEAQAHGALVFGDGGDGLDPLGSLDRIGIGELIGGIAEHVFLHERLWGTSTVGTRWRGRKSWSEAVCGVAVEKYHPDAMTKIDAGSGGSVMEGFETGTVAQREAPSGGYLARAFLGSGGGCLRLPETLMISTVRSEYSEQAAPRASPSLRM